MDGTSRATEAERTRWVQAARGPGLCASALLVVLALLSACRPDGSVVPDREPVHASTAALCQSTARPTRLVVDRIDELLQNHVRFTFPAHRVVRGAGKVAAVRDVLCRLPVMTGGVIACPADWGIGYRLLFSGRGQRFGPVTVNVTGCLTVRGLGSPRWVRNSPGFWPTLAGAMGVSGPAYPTLRGTPPS